MAMSSRMCASPSTSPSMILVHPIIGTTQEQKKKPRKPARHPRKWGWQHYCAACLQVKYCDADIRFEMQVTDTGLGERAVRQFDFARRRLDVWAGVFVTVVGADRGCQFGLRLAVGARSAWRGVGCEALRRCEGEGA